MALRQCTLCTRNSRSRNEHSNSKSISEQFHRPVYVLRKPEKL